MAGFVYIWRDRGRGMFYIGSHWGEPDDGYVCSSRAMLAEWINRPGDFRRRIIATARNPNDLRDEEFRWLRMIKRMGRYYNGRRSASAGAARVMLYLPPSVAKKVKRIAINQGCKPHDVFIDALECWLRSNGHTQQADMLAR